MDTDIDWSTDSNTNPLLDSIYTLASAAEIIRKPTTKTPRQAKNRKKVLEKEKMTIVEIIRITMNSTTYHQCNQNKSPGEQSLGTKG